MSAENTRIQLTGILTEAVDGKLTMTALDGFQMSVESASCEGDDLKIIVPANFLKLVSSAVASGEAVELYTDD